jgi:outer membrane protein OmpA-like peptidoglycan-associated protein
MKNMRLGKLNINYILKKMNLALSKTILLFVAFAAIALSGCSSDQPVFKFIKFHTPPSKAGKLSASKVDKSAQLARRSYYRKKLLAQGFKISKLGKWVQLDSPRALFFKNESANYVASAKYRLRLVNSYMSTFDVAGFRVSVYGAPPKTPAYEQALTNRCAQVIAASLNAKRGNVAFSEASGYGVNNPIALNNTASGRATNKRVNIRFELQQADLVLI